MNSGGTIGMSPLQVATVALISVCGTVQQLGLREQEAFADALVALAARESARLWTWRGAA